MAEQEQQQTNGQAVQNGNGQTLPPRCLDIASKGVRTGTDFANLMSALMSDLIEGRVTPMVGNATCNAAGKLLKVVEMQHKYGTDGSEQKGKKTLQLTD